MLSHPRGAAALKSLGIVSGEGAREALLAV